MMNTEHISSYADLHPIEFDTHGPLSGEHHYDSSLYDLDGHSSPWNGLNPRPKRLSLSHLYSQEMTPGPAFFPEAFPQLTTMNANPYLRGMRPSYEPLAPYPCVHQQPRGPSPSQSWAEKLSDTDCSSTTAGLSPKAPLSDGYHGAHMDPPMSFGDQSREVLHTDFNSRSGSSFVNPQHVQQQPDATEEMYAGPLADAHSPLSLENYHHLEVDFVGLQTRPLTLLTDGPCYGQHEETSLRHYSQGHDSGIGSSAIDDTEEIKSDVSADEEQDMPDADAAADSEYSPKTPPATRTRQRRASTRTGRGGNGSSTISPPSRSRRRASSGAGAGVTKSRATKRSTKNEPTRCEEHPTKVFKNQSELTKHMQTVHNRPFPCLLSPLCTSTFGSKNEWKRHISTQHLALSVYRCREPNCITPANAAGGTDGRFNDFNRKDLYTQHLRRMHTPAHIKNSAAGSNQKKAFEDAHFLAMQTRAKMAVRDAPQSVACLGCDKRFHGKQAWEERMECLGRHLEMEAKSGEHTLRDRGADEELVAWMVEEGLISGEDRLRLEKSAEADRDAEGDVE